MNANLNVVTLSRDNMDELELTLKSVYAQSERPSRHIVIDSSSAEAVSRVEEISKRYGAEFFWVPPEGIYAAMEFSLTLMQDDQYALWLNSSDWFAGPNVIKELLAKLNGDYQLTPWVIGQLLRWSSTELRLNKLNNNRYKTLARMRLGLSGFPHPSAVFSIHAVRKAGGYIKYRWMRVAQDYALALRMGRVFGPPSQMPLVVSIHVPMGFTSRNKARSFLERVASRLLENPFPLAVASIVLMPLLGLRAALNDRTFLVEQRSQTLEDAVIPAHYCSELRNDHWPVCCAGALGALRVYPDLRLSS